MSELTGVRVAPEAVVGRKFTAEFDNFTAN
jgi:hypothetical protein